MVYACAFAPIAYKDSLAKQYVLGANLVEQQMSLVICNGNLRLPLTADHDYRAYADSKTLTDEKREALYKDTHKDNQVAFACDVLSANDISINMLSRWAFMCAVHLSEETC